MEQTVETLLRKYLWAVDFTVVALCATFLGMAASGAVESKLAGMAVTTRIAPAKPAKPEGKAGFSKDPTAILRRNIFCSTCPPLLDEDAPADPTVTIEETKTALPLALLAIMYAPPPNGIKWSIAVMRDTEAKVLGAYPVGGKIH